VKITIDMPDETMREARLKAAELGISVHRFVSEAMEEKLVGESEQIEPEDRL
jgi:hypothetical protein